MRRRSNTQASGKGITRDKEITERRTDSRTASQVQRRLDNIEVHSLISAYLAGTPIAELSSDFRGPRATVFEHLTRHGVALQRNLRKLNDEQVTAAAELYDAGQSLKALG